MPNFRNYGFIWRCSIRRYVLKNCDTDAELSSFFTFVASYFKIVRNCPYRCQVMVVLWILAIYYLLFSFPNSKGQRQWIKIFFTKPCWDFCVYYYCRKTLPSLLRKCAADLCHILLASGIIPQLDLLSTLAVCSVVPSHCVYLWFRTSSNHDCIPKSFVCPAVILLSAVQQPWTPCSWGSRLYCRCPPFT